ncbi:MAG TPA: alanine:cation symporter family protein [Candidatus Hungatella pullicola]|nr:alanine:cation symporter family protein [Candidatus Hungatella pullicola]
MNVIESVFGKLADWLWGDWLLFALVGLGLYYTIMTGCIQLRCLMLIPRGIFWGGRKKVTDKEKCSSYQALCTAIASCVGSGNIVGVSTAVLAGGPGALFWMWVAALFGMATKFGEIVLGIRYHGQDEKGNIAGGPMYYIAYGLNWKWAGALVAVLLFIQNGGATLIQSNTISQVAGEAFRAPALATGIVLAVIMSLIISGGFKRLVQVAQNVVPFMAGIYLLGGLVVLIANAFSTVFPGMEYIIYISLLLFAGTSIMSQWYFGHISLTYLKKPGWAAVYRVVFPVLIIVGSLSTIDMVWSIQDVALGLLIIPNILALIVKGPEVRKMTKEFLDPRNGYVGVKERRK